MSVTAIANLRLAMLSLSPGFWHCLAFGRQRQQFRINPSVDAN